MILKYLAMGIMLFCVGFVTGLLWKITVTLAKNSCSKHILLSLIGALSMSVVFVYLIGNPSAWISV